MDSSKDRTYVALRQGCADPTRVNMKTYLEMLHEDTKGCSTIYSRYSTLDPLSVLSTETR